MPLCLYYYLLGIIIRPILFSIYINLLPNLRRILKLTTYITLIATNTYSCNIPLDKLIVINFLEIINNFIDIIVFLPYLS